MTEPLIIGVPVCDWVGLPFKDKRKGKWWHCKACRHHKIAKKPPPCPCKPIEIPPQTSQARSG